MYLWFSPQFHLKGKCSDVFILWSDDTSFVELFLIVLLTVSTIINCMLFFNRGLLWWRNVLCCFYSGIVTHLVFDWTQWSCYHVAQHDSSSFTTHSSACHDPFVLQQHYKNRGQEPHIFHNLILSSMAGHDNALLLGCGGQAGDIRRRQELPVVVFQNKWCIALLVRSAACCRRRSKQVGGIANIQEIELK